MYPEIIRDPSQLVHKPTQTLSSASIVVFVPNTVSRNETETSQKLQKIHEYVFDSVRVSWTLSGLRFSGSIPLYQCVLSSFSYLAVDSEMCRVAQSYRIDLAHQFQIVLQGQVKPSKNTATNCPGCLWPHCQSSDNTMLHRSTLSRRAVSAKGHRYCQIFRAAKM